MPPLAAEAARLHLFQRTANWVLPRLDRRCTAVDRAVARIPPNAWAVRRFWYHLLEWGRRGFDEVTLARRSLLRAAEAHRRAQVPDAALHERLRPPYPLGCKRLIYSNDFYPALTRPNVELVTDPIARVTRTGVVAADGSERALDALVCATGFDTTQPLSSVELRGSGGRTLREAWADGPKAYRDMTVAGFPNRFLMLGPSTGTGHTSTLLYIEPHVRHAIYAMRRVGDGGHRWLDVRPEVQAAHNAALQARLARSVWSACRGWYRIDCGRIVALWPGFTREYVRGLAQLGPGDYRWG